MLRDRSRPLADADDTDATADPRFAVVPRSTLPEEVANRLLLQIRAQELRPGDKLPAERQLAAMMAVSRPVVREALRALSLMGVVDIRQGDGTYVSSLEPRRLIAHLDIVFAKDTVALVQLLEARRVIETGNARLAARRVTEPEIAGLDSIMRDLAASIDDAERFSELDIAFHVAVCAAAGNVLLLQFMDIISTLGRASRERTGALPAVRKAAVRDHRRLLDALRAHDGDAAERAMRLHLDHVETGLQAALVSTTGPAGVPAAAAGGRR